MIVDGRSGTGFCSLVLSSLYFFFFQAEDGIRDLIVTGVDVCSSDLGTNRGADHGGPGLRTQSQVHAHATARIGQGASGSQPPVGDAQGHDFAADRASRRVANLDRKSVV